MVDLQAKCATDEERKRDTRDDSRLVAGALKTTPTQQQATFFSSEMTILVEHATRSPDGPKTAARSFFFFLKVKQSNKDAALHSDQLPGSDIRNFIELHSHATAAILADAFGWNGAFNAICRQ